MISYKEKEEIEKREKSLNSRAGTSEIKRWGRVGQTGFPWTSKHLCFKLVCKGFIFSGIHEVSFLKNVFVHAMMT